MLRNSKLALDSARTPPPRHVIESGRQHYTEQGGSEENTDLPSTLRTDAITLREGRFFTLIAPFKRAHGESGGRIGTKSVHGLRTRRQVTDNTRRFVADHYLVKVVAA